MIIIRALLVLIISLQSQGLLAKSLLVKILDQHNKSSKDVVHAVKTPSRFLRGMQFTFGGREEEGSFNEGRLEYKMRFHPNNVGEYSIKKKLWENEKKQVEFLNNDSLNEKYYYLYTGYLNVVYGIKLKEYYRQLSQIYDDKLNVLNRSLKSKNVDTQGLVKAHKDKNKYEQLFLMAEQELEHHLESFNELLGSDSKLSASDFKNESVVSLKSIQRDLESAIYEKSIGRVEMQRLEVENDLINSKLDKLDNERIFDYIELGVERRRDNRKIVDNPGSANDQFDYDYEHRFAFKINFKLPFFGDARQSYNNNLISTLKAKSKLTHESRAQRLEFNLLKRKINASINAITALSSSTQVKEAKKYLNIYSKRRSSDPQKILSFKESLVESYLSITELYFQTASNYLNYLRITGAFAKNTKKNFLAGNDLGVSNE